MNLSWKWYNIMPVRWQTFGATGSMTLISKTIPVHQEPQALEVVIYTVYIEYYTFQYTISQLHTWIRHPNLINRQTSS